MRINVPVAYLENGTVPPPFAGRAVGVLESNRSVDPQHCSARETMSAFPTRLARVPRAPRRASSQNVGRRHFARGHVDQARTTRTLFVNVLAWWIGRASPSRRRPAGRSGPLGGVFRCSCALFSVFFCLGFFFVYFAPVRSGVKGLRTAVLERGAEGAGALNGDAHGSR